MPRMPRTVTAILVIAALAGPATPAPAAESQSFRADYSVTLMGLPVGKGRFDSTFTRDRFSVEGSISSAGIARLFDRTTGTTRVEGSLNGDSVQPHAFSSAYDTGKKQSRTTIRFSGDRIASTENTPEPRKGENWIPVSSEHLHAALDPISSILIPAAGPDEVCNRTIRFFDGELRADLKLSLRGVEGEAVTCSAAFQPIAGYRKGRRQIEHLKNEGRIAITFARLGETGLYTPVDASFRTRAGTVRITASRIETR